jgi:hypothetical protein
MTCVILFVLKGREKKAHQKWPFIDRLTDYYTITICQDARTYLLVAVKCEHIDGDTTLDL